MAFQERKKIIEQIETKRKSKVVTLVTSDRLSTLPIAGIIGQISPDQVPQIIKHLKLLKTKFKDVDALDLYVHSSGGDINTAWPLVNVVRNHFKEFNILIPIRAHSAATLIALGSDNIVMTRLASISPVDPTVANGFNPKENNQPQGISVEDVTSFLALAREKEFNISSEGYITEVFKLLVDKIHPLALGNVKRSHTQIRELAMKLLHLHMNKEDSSIDSIVNGLTEKQHSHYHSIFKKEAESMGMKNMKDASDDEETLFLDLFKDYEQEMLLNKIFDANVFMGNSDEKLLETITTYMESTELSSKYVFKQNLIKTTLADPNYRLQVLVNRNQLSNNAIIVKAQIAQIEANVRAVYGQLAPMIQQNAGVPVLQGMPQQFTGIINSLSDLKNGITGEIDISSLKTQIEQKIVEIGWNN